MNVCWDIYLESGLSLMDSSLRVCLKRLTMCPYVCSHQFWKAILLRQSVQRLQICHWVPLPQKNIFFPSSWRGLQNFLILETHRTLFFSMLKKVLPIFHPKVHPHSLCESTLRLYFVGCVLYYPSLDSKMLWQWAIYLSIWFWGYTEDICCRVVESVLNWFFFLVEVKNTHFCNLKNANWFILFWWKQMFSMQKICWHGLEYFILQCNVVKYQIF